jgi:6-phosphogluconolactonase
MIKSTTQLASFVKELSDLAVSSGRAFNIALSGGSALSLLSQRLGESLKLSEASTDAKINALNWNLFFADERMVALDHVDSNYYQAKRELLPLLDFHEDQVFCPNTNLVCYQAADDYEITLSSVVPLNENGVPVFDLIILGIGPDGHTASLFPGHDQNLFSERFVVAETFSPKPPSDRISLSLQTINAARNVAFILGSNKQSILDQVIAEYQNDNPELPATRVKPDPGHLNIFMELN